MEEVEAILAEELGAWQPYEVANVYLVGSNLFGVAKPGKSDRDYVCIIRTMQDLPGIKYIERGDVNLAIYHVDTFVGFLRENVVWMVLFINAKLTRSTPNLFILRLCFSFYLRNTSSNK